MHGPGQRKNKEYESNLNLYRLDAGLTIKQLCDRVGIAIGTFCSLNNGMRSPLSQRGKNPSGISGDAQKLLDFFQISLSDAFPRYACDFDRQAFLTDDQISDITIGSVESTEAIMMKKQIVSVLNRLPERERIVIKLRFWDGLTQDECGVVFSVTGAMIGVIEARAIRRLRNSYNGLL